MKILFLFRGGYSFTGRVMSSIKSRLPMDNPEVASRIEFINTDKRNIEKLLKKLNENNTLPKVIYYSDETSQPRCFNDPYGTNMRRLIEKYPTIRHFQYSTNWKIPYDDIRKTMHESYTPKTYYGVPYNQSCDWCGEVKEITVGLFDKFVFPIFTSSDEAHKCALQKIEEKIVSYEQSNKIAKAQIQKREDFINLASKKVQTLNIYRENNN